MKSRGNTEIAKITEMFYFFCLIIGAKEEIGALEEANF